MMFMLSGSKKGFTLIEMLIVIAIIAVLIAIVVPTVTFAMEKTRETTDIANIRSSLATMTVQLLGNGVEQPVIVNLVQKSDGWQESDLSETLESLGRVVGIPRNEGVCRISYDPENKSSLFEFDVDGEFTGGRPVYDLTTTNGKGSYSAKTIEEGLKKLWALQEEDPNKFLFNGYIGDENGVSGANLDNFKSGSGKSFSLNGEVRTFSEFLANDTEFDHSDATKDINPGNFYLYFDENGNIPVFSYKEDVRISEYRYTKVTTFYNKEGEPIGTIEGGNPGYNELVGWVNNYLGYGS